MSVSKGAVRPIQKDHIGYRANFKTKKIPMKIHIFKMVENVRFCCLFALSRVTPMGVYVYIDNSLIVYIGSLRARLFGT